MTQSNSPVPLIMVFSGNDPSGGAGTLDHMVEVLSVAGASAVAAASIYHFTQQTPLEAKRHLAAHGVNVRLPA